ncbi:MAG TPA: hypothetical protein VL500_07890 [Candidatus Eisenbacteria bacterium]|nr:hypothetical protein [Candidatus Eisenbacteria bacterium]
MILFLDLRNDRFSFAAIEAKRTKWVRTPGAVSVGGSLAKALKAFGMPKRRPTAVIVAAGGDPALRNVSWSTVRAAVAAANALALAWNVPVASMPVNGDEEPAMLEKMIRAAAKGAKRGVWASARYSGEPTITKAKPLL